MDSYRERYVIVAVKDGGLKGEFVEVRNDGAARPLLPTGSQVNLEVPSDEDVLRRLLQHCLEFAS